MHACVCVEEGYFFRINSESWWPNSLPIAQAEHGFLTKDSYVECGSLLEFDDYEIEEALLVPSNFAGRLSVSMVQAIVAAVPQIPTLKPAEKEKIIATLSALLP